MNFIFVLFINKLIPNILNARAINKNKKHMKYDKNPIFYIGNFKAKTEIPIIRNAVDSNMSDIMLDIFCTTSKEIVFNSYLKNPHIIIPHIKIETIPEQWKLF